jgi:hypothetical protein
MEVLSGEYVLSLDGPAGPVPLDAAPATSEAATITVYTAELVDEGNYTFHVRPTTEDGAYRFAYALAPNVPARVVTTVETVAKDVCHVKCAWAFGSGVAAGLLAAVAIALVVRVSRRHP